MHVNFPNYKPQSACVLINIKYDVGFPRKIITVILNMTRVYGYNGIFVY